MIIYEDFLGILLFTTSGTNSYNISTAEKWVNSAINHKSSASMLTFFSKSLIYNLNIHSLNKIIGGI